MKKAVCLMCLLALFCTGAGAVGVWVDGEPVAFPDAQPFTDENGRTLVPVRPVAEKLGLTVEWDEANQRVILSREYTAQDSPVQEENETTLKYYQMLGLRFQIGNTTYVCVSDWTEREKDGSGVPSGAYFETTEQMDTAPVLKDGRTMIPLRYVTEWFHAAIGWKGPLERVVIDSGMDTQALLEQRYGLRIAWDPQPSEQTALFYLTQDAGLCDVQCAVVDKAEGVTAEPITDLPSHAFWGVRTTGGYDGYNWLTPLVVQLDATTEDGTQYTAEIELPYAT